MNEISLNERDQGGAVGPMDRHRLSREPPAGGPCVWTAAPPPLSDLSQPC